MTDTSDSATIACRASDAFGDWLSQSGGSLAVSTYQAGKVALIGWDGRQVSLLMRQFDKPMGVAVCESRLALATRHELWLFANASELAADYLPEHPGRYDALYLPRVSYQTGELLLHDVAYGSDRLWAVNTRFSCLSQLSESYSFEPLWKPSFISDLVPEDRCHLNGLAMCDGQPRYVTALGTTDQARGWRARKVGGGVVIDVATNDLLVRDLVMPHSPRWQFDQLWLLNSGRGELMVCNPADGRTSVVCQLPGYLRGLTFVGPYAVVGMSRIRERHVFGGLPIEEQGPLHCGLAVVDLRSGQCVAMFEFTEGCTELYDVQFLPGIQRPMLLNNDKPAAREALTDPHSSFWMRGSNESSEGRPDVLGASSHEEADLQAAERLRSSSQPELAS